MSFRAFVVFGLTALATVLHGSGAAAQNPVVVMDTSMGAISMELLPEQAPISVENFLAYVDEGHYENTVFHRVIQTFMIQGGAYTPDNQKKPTREPIKNEAANGLLNDKYTVAMARTNAVDSATDQFFINTADNAFLNHEVRDFGYAVFARVIDGTDVVDRIAATPVTDNVPNESVVIRSIRRQ